MVPLRVRQGRGFGFRVCGIGLCSLVFSRAQDLCFASSWMVSNRLTSTVVFGGRAYMFFMFLMGVSILPGP